MTGAQASTEHGPPAARRVGLLDPNLRRVFEVAGLAVGTLDPEGHVVSATAAFAERWSRPVDELVGRHLVGMWPDRHRAELTTALVRLVEGSADVEHVELAGEGGSTERVTIGRLPDGDGRTAGLVCAITEVDSIEAGTADTAGAAGPAGTVEANQLADRRRGRAAQLAPTTEELIEAASAGDAEGLLASALRRAARIGCPLALLRCEVSGLERAVADLGPDGPRHLESCWDRLFDRLRNTDTVMRTADDTFLVIAQDLGDEQDAAGVAYRLLSAAVEPITVDGRTTSVGMTIGVVIADAAASPRRMVEVAASALEEALSDGVGGFRLVDIRSGLAA